MHPQNRHLSSLYATWRKMPRWERWAWGFVGVFHLVVMVCALANGSYLWDDSYVYYTLAHNTISHGVYSQMAEAPFWPDTLRLPLYPALIAATGFQPWLLLVVQQGLFGLSVLALSRLLRPYLGPTAARWAALAWAVQPYPAWYSSIALTEMPFIALTLTGLWAVDAYTRRGGAGRVVLGLGLLALSALLKGLGLPVLLLAVVYIGARRGRQPATWAHIAMGVATGAAVLLPWMLRNQGITGQLQLANQSHVAFWYGRVGGMEALRQGLDFEESTLVYLADSMGQSRIGPQDSLYTYAHGERSMDFATLNPRARAAGWEYVRNNPRLTLQFHAQALGQMLAGVGYRTGLKTMEWQPIALILAGWQAVWNVLMMIGLGLWLWYIRRSSWLGWLLLAVAASFLFLHLAAWADGRYRMIADPLFIALGAMACQRGTIGRLARHLDKSK